MYILHHVYDIFNILTNKEKTDSPNHENKDTKELGFKGKTISKVHYI